MIDRFPLEIVVALNVADTMDDWLHDIEKEEHWHARECKSDPISGETNVQHTVSFKRSV